MTMHFDFSTVAEDDLFTSVPEGRYACSVAEVRESLSKDGSPRWVLKLEVCDGEFAGRTAGWDSLTWSDRGVHRVQLVLCALGVDARGEVELEAEELIGRKAMVSFESELQEDPVTGKRKLWLRVPYDGFKPICADDADEDDAPHTGRNGSRDHNGRAVIDGEGGDEESSGDGPFIEGAAAAAF